MADEHNTAGPGLRIGTLDWRHADWDGKYYPDDLPEDWQLGYYGNEAAAVLVPAARWIGHTPAELAEWRDEAHEGFRFYLMGDVSRDADSAASLGGVLGDRLGGLVWPEADAPEGWLAAEEEGLPERVDGWSHIEGLVVALMHVDGLDLRARRGLLESLAPRLTTNGPAAVFLAGDSVTPADARELQTVAELMGLA